MRSMSWRGDLLDGGQRLVERRLRGRGDVDEHASPVVAVAAAHDVALAFEVVEQRRDGAARDVHARGDLTRQHRLAFALDHRERVQRRMGQPVTATDRADRGLDERADDLEFPGAAGGEPPCARELAFECDGLGRPARRQGLRLDHDLDAGRRRSRPRSPSRPSGRDRRRTPGPRRPTGTSATP